MVIYGVFSARDDGRPRLAFFYFLNCSLERLIFHLFSHVSAFLLLFFVFFFCAGLSKGWHVRFPSNVHIALSCANHAFLPSFKFPVRFLFFSTLLFPFILTY